MSIFATNPLHQSYQDLDGSPLNAGYLYFGVANLNPETNPITVYWDAAQTQPAAQPIRTLNGVTVRNGSPAIVYAPSNYSLTVKNKNGILVYNEPTAIFSFFGFIVTLATSIGASLIGFIQDGIGAVIRTVQAKLRERVSVLDFGADPTGAVDSRDAFAAAFATGKAVRVPHGTYRVDSPIALDASPIGNFTMLGESPHQSGTTGTGQVVIDLTNNTTYFCAVGYAYYAKSVVFKNGVDVFHYNSQGVDTNFTVQKDIRAFNWTGTFFLCYGAVNGTHNTWVRPLFYNDNASAVVFDDSTNFPAGGLDNLTITDGVVEGKMTVSFKASAWRFSMMRTRLVPFDSTPQNSVWFIFTVASDVTFTDTDFGGEAVRSALQWRGLGGSLAFYNCGLYYIGGGTNPDAAIDLYAPPERIIMQNTTGLPQCPGVFCNQNMSAAHLADWQKTQLVLIDNAPNLLHELMGRSVLSSPYNAWAASKLADTPAVVSVGDIKATTGSSWQSSSSTSYGAFTVTTGAAVTDVLGSNSNGYHLICTATGEISYLMNNAPSVSGLVDGEYTFEALCTVGGNAIFVEIYFGSEGTAPKTQLRKGFILGPGTYTLCFPVMLTAGMDRNIGFAARMRTGTTLTMSRFRVFNGTYNQRQSAFIGAAVDSATTYQWSVGDRIIRVPAASGQPVAWSCVTDGVVATSAAVWKAESTMA